MHNPESLLENKTDKLLWDFDTNGSYNLGQTTIPIGRQEKKTEPAQ